MKVGADNRSDGAGRADMEQGGLEYSGGPGLYVHVPYCTSKCPYCDFNSVALTGPSAFPFEEERFIDALISELDTVLEVMGCGSFNPVSLYFGGGTPSLLAPLSIARFIEHVKERGAAGLAEVTLEANPESVTPDKLSGYFEAGVNRLSLGIQSFNDIELKRLGRPHSVKEAFVAFEAARGAGFENIGIDLIFGVPGAQPDSMLSDWKESLLQVAELSPEHISLYGLTIEEGTPFHELYPGGAINDDLYTLLYSYAVDALITAGYDHYEISNFAGPGRRSLHNGLYWSGAEYIGLGPGAHTFVHDTRWGRRSWNVTGVAEYMGLIESAGTAASGTEELDMESAILEAAMLGLRRLDRGIVAEEFEARFNISPSERFIGKGHGKKMVKGGAGTFIEQGLLCKRGEDLLLTSAGVLLSDTVIAGL